MSITARDQSLDRLVTWRSALLGTTTSSPCAVRTLVTRNVSSSTVPVMPVDCPGTESRMTSPKANWCSANRKKPASRSPTICWAPKPSPMPITVAGATSVLSGTPNRSRARMAVMKPTRATTTHSTASLTARDRLRFSEATCPDSIWAADLAVDPAATARPHPVGEPDEESGSEQEHDGRKQMVLEPGVVDACPENTIHQALGCPSCPAPPPRPGQTATDPPPTRHPPERDRRGTVN